MCCAYTTDATVYVLIARAAISSSVSVPGHYYCAEYLLHYENAIIYDKYNSASTNQRWDLACMWLRSCSW